MTARETPFELETWTVPGDSRDRDWGEGIVVRRRDGPTVFFRFYEFNLFDAVRPGGFTKGDKEQPHAATVDGSEATIEYPDHGVRLDVRAVETGVDLSVRVENRGERDWPELAALDPCLNPGRDRTDTPIVSELADETQQHTYYHGRSGLTLLAGRTLHLHEDYHEAVIEEASSGTVPPAEDLPWDWCDADATATKSLLVRESPDGAVSTGIAWEDALGAQGHNPWNCMHLLARVGPLPAGDARHVRGKIYLENGGKEAIVERYASDFGE